MEDLKRDISDIINERLKSPILGAFAIAWIGWNWEVIIYLIFDATNAVSTVSYLKDCFLNDIKPTLIYPILSALLYPLISLAAFSYNELIEAVKSKVNFKIHEKTPIDANQKFELLKNNLNQKSEFQSMIADKDKEIEVQKQSVSRVMDDYSKQLEEKDSEIARLKNELKDKGTETVKLSGRLKELEKSNQEMKKSSNIITRKLGDDGDVDFNKILSDILSYEIPFRIFDFLAQLNKKGSLPVPKDLDRSIINHLNNRKIIRIKGEEVHFPPKGERFLDYASNHATFRLSDLLESKKI